MPGIKELKTRIKSIGGTRKITRAMQMVSAAKMRKSQSAVVQSRNYAGLAWGLIETVAEHSAFEHPLIRTYPVAAKIGVVLLASNKGLVGSLNSNLLKLAGEAAGDNQEIIAGLITYGKKGQIIAARLNKEIIADFPKLEGVVSVEDIYPIAKFITDAYSSGQYKKIVIVYNHFVSTIQQKPTVRQLLPFANSGQKVEGADLGPNSGILYEPSPKTVIEHLMPRIIESQIYQTILESNASEHSARMVMMKNATEAAGDLISDLTLTYNQLRQGKITTELAEITAGRIALE